MFSVSNRAVVVLCIALVLVTGCKSKSASPPVAEQTVAEQTDGVANDSPQWIDVATAVPVAITVRPDGRQVIVDAPPAIHAYGLPSGKLLHTWPHQVQVFHSGDGMSVLTVLDSVTSVSDAESFQVQHTNGTVQLIYIKASCLEVEIAGICSTATSQSISPIAAGRLSCSK